MKYALTQNAQPEYYQTKIGGSSVLLSGVLTGILNAITKT
jgi:hypothetical protein